MVSEEEWSVIKDQFYFDEEIYVTRNRSGPELLRSYPPVCVECVDRRMEEEEREKLTYSRLPVYVRLLTGADKDPDPKVPRPAQVVNWAIETTFYRVTSDKLGLRLLSSAVCASGGETYV